MKSGEKPQFSSAWWLKNKAATLTGTDLDKALAAYEKPFAKFVANPCAETPSLKAAGEALKKLAASVAATIGKCNGTLHKETLECLKKFDPLIKAKQKSISVELNRREQVDALTLAGLLAGPHQKAFVAFGTKRASGELVEYLVAVGPSGKGDAAVFNKFIKNGAAMEINIDAVVRAKFCRAGDDTMTIPRDDLDKAPWAAVHTEMKLLTQRNLVDGFKALLKDKAHSFAGLFT